jgi:hypothetical protein
MFYKRALCTKPAHEPSFLAELACPAAQIGEKLSAENEGNLDKQQAGPRTPR